MLDGYPENGIYLIDDQEGVSEVNCAQPERVETSDAKELLKRKRTVKWKIGVKMADAKANSKAKEPITRGKSTADEKADSSKKSKEKNKASFGLPSAGSMIEEGEESDSEPPLPEPTPIPPKRKKRRRVLMRKWERELRLWHLCYGHIAGLKQTIDARAVTGLPTDYHSLFCQDDFCVMCLHGKQKLDDHGPIIRTPREIGELFHVDITYHSTESVAGKKKYTLCQIEHKSRVDFPSFLRKKSDTGEELKKTILRFEQQTGKPVKIIQCDGALEFIAPGSVMRAWCVGRGMIVRNSSTNVQEENGIAEAGNLRRGTAATMMRIGARLSSQFECEAERLAAILYSHIVKASKSGKSMGISGYEMIWNKKPDCELIHPFGCHGYAWRSKRTRKRSGNPSKTRPCLYMGPAIDAAGYRCYDPFSKKMFQQSSVLFDEYLFGIPELVKKNKGHKKFMEC